MIVSVGALTYAPERNDSPAVPAGYAATPSPEWANLPDVPMPGANSRRTNVQPGPGLTMLPEIVGRSDIAGNKLVLADDTLLIMSDLQLTAVDAMTLAERWSTRLAGAAYSAPLVADGRIYFTATTETESTATSLTDNYLIAHSMDDGHELWRVAGAGVYPANPLVVNDVVYSLGARDERYMPGVYRVADGEPIWQVQTAPYEWCCALVGTAYADGLLAISTLETLAVHDAAGGHEVWADQLQNTDPPGHGSIPVIVGDLLLVSVATEFGMSSPDDPVVGATTGFDRRTGEVRWWNEATRSYFATLVAPNV